MVSFVCSFLRVCTLVCRPAIVTSAGVSICLCGFLWRRHVGVAAQLFCGVEVWLFCSAWHTAKAALIVRRGTLCRFPGMSLQRAWPMLLQFLEQVYAQVRQAALVLFCRSMSAVTLVDYLLRIRVSRQTTKIFLAAAVGFFSASMVFVSFVFLSCRILY